VQKAYVFAISIGFLFLSHSLFGRQEAETKTDPSITIIASGQSKLTCKSSDGLRANADLNKFYDTIVSALKTKAADGSFKLSCNMYLGSDIETSQTTGKLKNGIKLEIGSDAKYITANLFVAVPGLAFTPDEQKEMFEKSISGLVQYIKCPAK
jgi:hypothetical protein